jgi:hypothetical protein
MISGILIFAMMLSPVNAETPNENECLLECLLAQLAVPDHQQLHFAETRQSALLAAPLEITGVLYRDDQGRLIRETHGPREETQILAADHVEVRRPTGYRQRFSLRRAPELAALRQALGAILDGDVNALTEHFEYTLEHDDQEWTLTLAPIDPTLAERVASLRLQGSTGELASLRLTTADGETIETRFLPEP